MVRSPTNTQGLRVDKRTQSPGEWINARYCWPSALNRLPSRCASEKFSCSLFVIVGTVTVRRWLKLGSHVKNNDCQRMPKATAGDRHVEKPKWVKKMGVLTSIGQHRKWTWEIGRGSTHLCKWVHHALYMGTRAGISWNHFNSFSNWLEMAHKMAEE